MGFTRTDLPPHSDAHDLPGHPAEPGDRARAVVLLGAATQAPLTDRRRAELVALIGVYPTKEQAARWKRWLKATR